MSYRCAQCANEISLLPGAQISRTETCDSCNADLHACVQCDFYDISAYNECRESQAERVVEKERSNFCDYFTLAKKVPDHGKPQNKGGGQKADALKKLDDLFSK